MTNDDGRKPEGAPERSPKAGAGAPSGVEGNGPKRFSVRRKLAVVARLLRGEPLELVARETNVSVAKLTEWRDRALRKLCPPTVYHLWNISQRVRDRPRLPMRSRRWRRMRAFT